ncbi:hypothetical protein IFM89_017746 [Coptis chinensis]|uniref:Uncharacterized protein n=1 Tax=Coptis chinensis TaxID=261450 RepID=A0A835LJR4_9MAGN|nr:hypothetical protein IFM89_017746 [Coptis chinensis]
MTPAQVTMETVVEETGTKGLETVKEDMSLRCVSNCEDTAFDLEMLSDPKVIELGVVGNSDDVDIEGCCGDVRMGENGDDDMDATECSSSFGNSFSGNEDGLGMSDYDEIDSLYGEASLFDGFDRMFRTGKKKVTTQWRRYISPLTWRAKWMELRIKEMKSQLSKYDRELASYNQRELQFDVGQCTSEDVSVKSLPFSGQSHKKEVMKRKKRKRIEDVADVASYMSHHNLFSYYENKKSDADGASIDVEAAVQVISADVNTKDEFDINYACPSLEFRDENSLEHVLWKIEKVQLRVQKLKTQTDSLLTVHAAKFSSMESLSQLAQSDLPSSSPRSPALSSGNAEKLAIRGLCTPPRHIADYDIGDLVLPGSAVSSNGEVTPHPDLIESSLSSSICRSSS